MKSQQVFKTLNPCLSIYQKPKAIARRMKLGMGATMCMRLLSNLQQSTNIHQSLQDGGSLHR
jgi:hypothetical protein